MMRRSLCAFVLGKEVSGQLLNEETRHIMIIVPGIFGSGVVVNVYMVTNNYTGIWWLCGIQYL